MQYAPTSVVLLGLVNSAIFELYEAVLTVKGELGLSIPMPTFPPASTVNLKLVLSS